MSDTPDKNEYSFLDHIDSPQELRLLPESQLDGVCSDVRNFIIDHLCCNPGHFAASLGTVELAVALHYVFNTPQDKIVWDVGHQAYAHKILTKRKNRFSTNRKLHGLSGFPSPAESEYDAFQAGHASNSISAALGMAVAAALNNDNKHTVAVIGDGSLTGGLAFEGLNNASSFPNNLLIILNDNNMAIDRSVGGLSEYLVKITTSQTYNKVRYGLYKSVSRYSCFTDETRKAILRFNNALKSLFTREHNIFEGFNIRYFGPVDGHNVQQLVKILNDIKDMKGPKILHIKTIKGKGFKPAEDSATEWHAPGLFDKTTGKRAEECSPPSTVPKWQDVFGKTLVELAAANKKIVGVTPAMPTGCSMNYLFEEFPERAFDVGIAEGHAVTFSGGLSKEGMIPFCNIYSSFMQRAFDNVIHDVALQRLPVVFCLDRAGIVGEDGPTHHGVYDLAYFRAIPDMIISSPMDADQLRNLMLTAAQNTTNPFVIRYPKGSVPEGFNWAQMQTIPIGKGRCLVQGEKVAILTIGPIGKKISMVSKEIMQKFNITIAHYDMRFLKPIDEEILHQVGQKFNKIITIEDGTVKGGLGSEVAEFMVGNQYKPDIRIMGIPDQFIEHGTITQLHSICHLDEDNIIEMVKSLLSS